MGRSVSYPAGAQVAFLPLDTGEDDDFEWEYQCLIDDIRDTVRQVFPSFDAIDCWRGREDRVLMRNTFADIGISTYGGIAAVWLAERSDTSYAYAREWGRHSALAQGWISQAAPRFDRLFGTLDRLGQFSNGEAIYQLRKAA